jgi:hypothetical protein
MMKVLNNFLCNGLSGVKGQILSNDDLKIIGDQVEGLKKAGCLESVTPIATPAPAKLKEEKPEVEFKDEFASEKPSKKKSK